MYVEKHFIVPEKTSLPTNYNWETSNLHWLYFDINNHIIDLFQAQDTSENHHNLWDKLNRLQELLSISYYDFQFSQAEQLYYAQDTSQHSQHLYNLNHFLKTWRYRFLAWVYEKAGFIIHQDGTSTLTHLFSRQSCPKMIVTWLVPDLITIRGQFRESILEEIFHAATITLVDNHHPVIMVQGASINDYGFSTNQA